MSHFVRYHMSPTVTDMKDTQIYERSLLPNYGAQMAAVGELPWLIAPPQLYAGNWPACAIGCLDDVVHAWSSVLCVLLEL